jgi:hypothetical protein
MSLPVPCTKLRLPATSVISPPPPHPPPPAPPLAALAPTPDRPTWRLSWACGSIRIDPNYLTIDPGVPIRSTHWHGSMVGSIRIDACTPPYPTPSNTRHLHSNPSKHHHRMIHGSMALSMHHLWHDGAANSGWHKGGGGLGTRQWN